MVYNSEEIRTVDITWRDGEKSITVYLNNGEKYHVKNDNGAMCPGNKGSKE